MRLLGLSFILIFIGGYSNASHSAPGTPPNGKTLFHLVFEKTSHSLASEGLCQVISENGSGKTLTLGEQLANAFSSAHDPETRSFVSSQCHPSKHETAFGKTINIWDCSITILENSIQGGFISSATVAFAVSINHSKILPGTIRCI